MVGGSNVSSIISKEGVLKQYNVNYHIFTSFIIQKSILILVTLQTIVMLHLLFVSVTNPLYFPYSNGLIDPCCTFQKIIKTDLFPQTPKQFQYVCISLVINDIGENHRKTKFCMILIILDRFWTVLYHK